ncbi:MAG TPA: pyridoxamine 5'-phosphate oxidase family protein [Acidimicrobiia bacterium]|nr:pyridoxamine 5'-phosphate oxidase family protein [Acidimicrobiia bacterium]
MSNRGLDILTAEESNELLTTHTFGRVVAKVGAEPAAYPVYYAFVDGTIVYRTDPGTKLAAAVLHNRVSFEVDSDVEGWSVMAFGPCEEVRRPHEIDACHAALGTEWPDAERQRVVRIRPDRITGRRLQRPRSAEE